MDQHREHYAEKEIEPILMMEQIIVNENLPPKARLNMAQSLRYITRAGSKKGEDWRKELAKAENYIHRARTGNWIGNDDSDIRDHDQGWARIIENYVITRTSNVEACVVACDFPKKVVRVYVRGGKDVDVARSICTVLPAGISTEGDIEIPQKHFNSIRFSRIVEESCQNTYKPSYNVFETFHKPTKGAIMATAKKAPAKSTVKSVSKAKAPAKAPVKKAVVKKAVVKAKAPAKSK